MESYSIFGILNDVRVIVSFSGKGISPDETPFTEILSFPSETEPDTDVTFSIGICEPAPVNDAINIRLGLSSSSPMANRVLLLSWSFICIAQVLLIVDGLIDLRYSVGELLSSRADTREFVVYNL